VLLVVAIAAAAVACSSRKTKQAEAQKPVGPPATEAAALPSPAASVIPDEADPEPRRERSRPKLRLTLRSTPAGATAAVDGRQVGLTPLVHEIEQDGRIHEFTFVKTGYIMEHYKFQPVRDGVIHAPLRPLVAAPDAGPPAP
jgi:hypothetical protein